MDSIIHPFSLPIYQNFIDKESFKIIKEDTIHYIQNNSKLFKNIWFCPTLTTHGVDKKLNIKSPTLETQIKKHIENYFKVWDFNFSFNLKLNEIWVNVATPQAYQEEHHHGVNLFSGVLYISTNDLSGDFQIINPLSSESILMGHPGKFDFKYDIKPKDSMIVIFPGWLKHRAVSNNSNEDRISISFNIQYETNTLF